MPNGGSDHCGNCRHNRVNVGRESTPEERRGTAFCTIRNVEVRASYNTYCANHYESIREPVGPMYASLGDHERIPYHGASRPGQAEVARCLICGNPGERGVQVADAALGALEFCGAPHYARWWKQAHPGEALRWDCDKPPLSADQERALEVAAMLELARAFVAAEDAEGARQVLEQLLEIAGEPQRSEARAMLATIAAGRA